MRIVTIQSRQTTANNWGTVDALTGENKAAFEAEDYTKLLAIADTKLARWRDNANDYKGAFADWQFRVADITT